MGTGKDIEELYPELRSPAQPRLAVPAPGRARPACTREGDREHQNGGRGRRPRASRPESDLSIWTHPTADRSLIGRTNHGSMTATPSAPTPPRPSATRRQILQAMHYQRARRGGASLPWPGRRIGASLRGGRRAVAPAPCRLFPLTLASRLSRLLGPLAGRRNGLRLIGRGRARGPA